MSDEVREWVRQARAGDPAAYDGPSLEAVEALLKRVTELEAERDSALDREAGTADALDSAYQTIQKLRTNSERLEAALHTVRMECDLPEHIAEIVGTALGGDGGHRDDAPGFRGSAISSRNDEGAAKRRPVTEGMTDDEQEKWYGGVGYPDE